MKEYDLKTQAVYVFIGKIFSLFFQLLTPIILVRIFSKTDYGLYQQILSLSMIALPFLGFSLNNSLYYFYSKNTIDDNKSYLSQAFYIPILFGSLLMLGLFLFNDYVIINSFGNKFMLLVTILFFFISANSRLLDNIFILEEKAFHSLFYFSFDKLARLIFLLILVLIFETVISAIVALTIYNFLKFFYLYFYLRSNYQISIFSFKKNNLFKQIRYSIPLYISTIIGKTSAHMDKILLITFLTSSDFAVYAVGSFRIPFIALLYSSIGNVVMPKLSEYSKRNDYHKAHQLWIKMVIKNSMLTIPVVIFFIYIAPILIVLLFTDSYIDSIVVFQITILTLLIQMLGHGYLLKSFAKTKQILYANIVKAIITLIFGYILVSELGIIGAAILYVTGFTINALIQLIKSKNIFNYSWFYFFPYKDIIVFFIFSFICLFFIYLLKNLINNNYIYILVSSIIYFTFYLLMLLKFRYVKFSDLNLNTFKKM